MSESKGNSMSDNNSIQSTVDWFKAIYPEPTSKNLHTQIGVHFEEVAEFIESLRGNNHLTQLALSQALGAVKALSFHLKKEDNVLIVDDGGFFLDALGDQIVTATGCAHMAGMDMVGAFGEINRSNWTKFDENGKPVLDDNLKMVKSSNYQAPNLIPYL